MQLRYETPRLILQVLKADNANAAAVLGFYQRDRELFERYEPDRVPNYYTASFQKTVLKYEYNLAVKQNHIRYYIFRKENPDQIIGTVCFHDIEQNYYSSCEIGYKISSEFQRKGYAKEAIGHLIVPVFETLNLHRISAWVDTENTPSMLLLEKLDFEREGLCRDFIRFRGQWHDHYQYCLPNPFHDL